MRALGIGVKITGMKTDIHPAYFPKAKVTCSCGAKFEIGSTKEVIDVEICSNCHPFYSGGTKLIDTAGRVEKFRAKQAARKVIKSVKSVKSIKS